MEMTKDAGENAFWAKDDRDCPRDVVISAFRAMIEQMMLELTEGETP